MKRGEGWLWIFPDHPPLVIDLVEALAAPLPVTVIAHMLGVVDGDMKQFKAWSDKIFTNIGDILFAHRAKQFLRIAQPIHHIG